MNVSNLPVIFCWILASHTLLYDLSMIKKRSTLFLELLVGQMLIIILIKLYLLAQSSMGDTNTVLTTFA